MTLINWLMPAELVEASRSDLGPCVICVMAAKGTQVLDSRPAWEPLAADGDMISQVWIPAAEKTPARNRPVINEAFMVGICELFPGVLMPVCWQHVGAIDPPVAPGPACTWCEGTGVKKQAPPQLGGGLALPNGYKKRGTG